MLVAGITMSLIFIVPAIVARFFQGKFGLDVFMVGPEIVAAGAYVHERILVIFAAMFSVMIVLAFAQASNKADLVRVERTRRTASLVALCTIGLNVVVFWWAVTQDPGILVGFLMTAVPLIAMTVILVAHVLNGVNQETQAARRWVQRRISTLSDLRAKHDSAVEVGPAIITLGVYIVIPAGLVAIVLPWHAQAETSAVWLGICVALALVHLWAIFVLVSEDRSGRVIAYIYVGIIDALVAAVALLLVLHDTALLPAFILLFLPSAILLVGAFPWPWKKIPRWLLVTPAVARLARSRIDSKIQKLNGRR